MLLVLTVVLSVSAISASEVNVTDSYATNLVDDTSDVSVPIDNAAGSSDISVSSDSKVDNDPSKVSLSSEEVLESENSNTLSTNTDNTSLGSANDENNLTATQSTELTPSSTNVYYKSPFSVVLKDKNGILINGKKVSFVINGKSYSASTNDKGVASVDLTLAPGKYTVDASFGGDSVYSSAKLSTTFNVLATVKASDLTKYYKGSQQFTATFVNGQGAALANTNVKFTVDGKTYTRKTNSKGVASLVITLKPGTYKIVSTDPVTGYSVTNNIKVLSTIVASDVSKVYTDGKTFYARFLTSEGKRLANTNVKFNINGVTYTVKTSAKGYGILTLYDLEPGTYKMTSYNVDGLTATNTVKVVRTSASKLTAKDYTYYTYNKKIIQVTLHNQFGYAPGAGKVIYFAINGKTYTATTNSNGVASLKLPVLNPGVYTVKYAFAGNSFYTKSSTSSLVSVIPSKTPTYTVKSATTFGKASNSTFTVALTSGDVPLVNRAVVFTLNGVSYTKTTDSKGLASVPINLGVGTYKITYSNTAGDRVAAKTGSTNINVVEKSATSLTWKSAVSFKQGSQTYKVLLADSNNKALSNKLVKLTVNSNTYSATTTSDGLATFNVNLNANPGTYTVSYSFAGDNLNAASSGSTKITITQNTDLKGYGYWVFGSDMKSVNLKALAAQGTTDVFLNYYAIEKHGQAAVESWIEYANNKGMRVHIWMQAFYDGEWINPVTAGSSFINSKVSEAVKYAKIKGVAGVHLDYLRYGGTAYKTNGGTQTISDFVKKVTTAIHEVNPNLIVSCALMPEPDDAIYYYGQDYSVISQYMDVVIPMIYKGNYEQSSSWIKTTTKWYVDNSKGAKVWAGLQGYKSDDDVTKLSTSEMTADVKNALDGKGSGAIIFRWGVTNFVDFNSLNGGSSSSSSNSSSSSGKTATISIANILIGANNLKTYYANNNKMPTAVSAGGHIFTLPEFLYLMSQAIYQLGSSNTKDITCLYGVSAPPSPTGDTIYSVELYRADYLTVAKNVATYIKNKNRAPNYATSTVGNIIYSELLDAFSRILTFYKNNDNYMPNYVVITYGSSSSSSSSSIGVGGLNVKNTISNLAPYLVATTNCQVGNSAIKNLAASLTSGLTTDLQKATAIYNYVRDKISYSFYYDTQYGAVGTLNAKAGNCVDQAHLVVALSRAAGLAARYEHGTCYFTSSGSTYGHVWAQVLVNNVWVVADPTSTRNAFGTVNNWATSSYSHHAYYASLPF